MSELDPSTVGSVHDVARAHDVEIAALIGERTEREGLPRNYRMRADAHYVDQLDRPQGPVVRLIATRNIDAVDLPPAATVSPLSQSIAAHGILQPLLVRRAGARYQLIAGRKRLAAAVSGGVNDVPCIIHEVSESGAAAIAEAERAATASAAEPVQPNTDSLEAVFPELSQDLTRIGSLADVLELANNPFQHRTAADFLRAETWRIAWLVNAAAIAANPQGEGRVTTLSRALDRVRNGFEPEMRLAKLKLDLSATADCGDAHCDERFGVVVSGLIFATLSWLQGAEAPRIEVRVDSPSPQTLRMQMVQRLAPAPAYVTAATPAGTVTETMAFTCARAFAATQTGSFEIGPAGPRGALIQLVFSRSQPA